MGPNAARVSARPRPIWKSDRWIADGASRLSPGTVWQWRTWYEWRWRRDDAASATAPAATAAPATSAISAAPNTSTASAAPAADAATATWRLRVYQLRRTSKRKWQGRAGSRFLWGGLVKPLCKS